jgi:cell division protein FtsB
MRLLLVSLLLILVLVQARLWLSDEGLREVWRLETQVDASTMENRRLAARNYALEAEVQDLKQGLAAAEERARTDLGMIAGGETFYQIMPHQPPTRERPAR